MKRNKRLIGVTLAVSMISADIARTIPIIYSYAESRVDENLEKSSIGALGKPNYHDNKVTFPSAAYEKEIYGFEVQTNSSTSYTLDGEKKSSQKGVIKGSQHMTGKEFTEFLNSIEVHLNEGSKANISVKVEDIKSNIDENGITKYNEHYYKIIDAAVINKTDALNIANKMYYKGSKGYLASVDSDAEKKFIIDSYKDKSLIVDGDKVLHTGETIEGETNKNKIIKPTDILVEFGGRDIETDSLVIAEGIVENKGIKPKIQGAKDLKETRVTSLKVTEGVSVKNSSSLFLGKHKNNSDSKTVTFPDAYAKINKRAVLSIKSNTKSKLIAIYTDNGVKKDLTLSSTDPTLISITSQVQADEILKSLAIKYETDINNKFSIGLFYIPENTIASADSVSDPAKTADKSIDGLYTTTWQGMGDGKSVVIDFTELTDISDILVSMYDEELKVEGFNGTSWENLGRMKVSDNRTLNHKDIPFDVSKSYSKLRLTTYSTGWSDIAEVEISKDGYQLIDLDAKIPVSFTLGEAKKCKYYYSFPDAIVASADNISKLKTAVTCDEEYYIQYSRNGQIKGLRNSNLDINDPISPTEAQEILRSIKIYTKSKVASQVSISLDDKESNTTIESILTGEPEKSSGTISIGEPIKQENYYTFPNVEVTNTHDILGFQLNVDTNKGFVVDYILNGNRVTNYNKIINFYDRYTVEEVNEILKSLRIYSYSNEPIKLTVTLGNLKEGVGYNPLNGHYYFIEKSLISPGDVQKFIDIASQYNLYGHQGYPATITDPFENDFVKSNPMGSGNSNVNYRGIGVKYNSKTNKQEWFSGSEIGEEAQFIPEGSTMNKHSRFHMIYGSKWLGSDNVMANSLLIEFGDKRLLAPTTKVSGEILLDGINIPEEEQSSGTISIGEPVKEENYYTFPNVEVTNTHDILGFKININSTDYFMSSYELNGNRVNNYNKTVNFYERYSVAEVDEILKSLRVYSYSNEPIKLSVTLGNLKDGYSYNPINGHYYFIEKSLISPGDVQKFIDIASQYNLYGHQGYPATITDPFENDFAKSKPMGSGNSNVSIRGIGVKYNTKTKKEEWFGGPEIGKEAQFIPEGSTLIKDDRFYMICGSKWFSDNTAMANSLLIEFGEERLLRPTTQVTSAEVELEGVPAKNNIELKEPKISDNTITFPDANVIVEHPMELNIDYDVNPGTKITTEYTLDGNKIISNENRITTKKITQNQASEILNTLEVTTEEPKTLKIDIQMLNGTTEDGNPIKDNAIIDREAPRFSFTGDKIEIIRGNNYNFDVLLKAHDDIDDDVSNLVKLSFLDKDNNPVDKIDTINYGKWIARLEVEDKSGNKANKDIPVNIIKDPALITERIKLSGNKFNPDGVTLNWTKTNNVEKYKVYKKTKDADYREIFEVSNPKGLALFVRSRNTDDMSFIDTEVQDTTAPNISHYLHVLLSEKTVRFEFPIDDFADDIEYQIRGFDNEEYIDAYSNSLKIKSKASGFKGFSYVKDNNPITAVDETVDTTNNKFRFNDVKEDEYLHIAAIDNNGNKSETLHIKLLDGTYNNTPSISVQGLNQVINKNGEFDPLKGVTAYDFEDGDLTEKIVVTGTVDTTKSGTQSIIYTVEDADGVSTSLTVNIHIAGDMDLKVSDGYNSLNLDWTKEPKADKYKIFRSSSDGTDLEEILEITDIDTISYLDAAAVDTRVSNIKSVQEIKNTEDAEAILKVRTKDFSSTYRYFIQAVDEHNNYVNSSEIKHGTSATGVVGYSYTIDDIRDTTVDEHMDTTDLASIDLKNNFGKILHIRAIDGNGNASIVKHHIIGGRYDTDLIPVIYGLDTLRVKVGEEIGFMKGVTASDVEDGDITKDIKVIGAVNNKENNKYKVTYSVTDSDENTRTVDRDIIVKGEYPNTVAKANKSSNKISLTWEKNSIDTGSNIIYEIQRFNKELDGYKAINVDTGITSFEDAYSSDLLGPIVNKIDHVRLPGSNKVKFTVDSEDIGVEYHYKIVHRLDDFTIIGESNEAKASIIGTVKGYSYALSNDMDYKVGNKINITNTKEFEVDPGAYKYIHFAPIDSYGNKGQQVTVSFRDINNAPELRGVRKKYVQLGSNFDKMKGVTAHDKEDGDLTKDIKVIGDVNPFKTGSYTLRYSVKDKKGAETVRSRTVKVIQPKVVITDVPTEEMSEAPTVYMNPIKLYLLVNSKDYSLMSGITVKDKEDGDITHKVKYTTDININKVGNYSATYTVSDSDKNIVKWNREIVVVSSKDALPVLPEDVTDRAPWIKAEKTSIPWGKDFNIMTGIVAEDFEDGNINHLVRSKGNVNVGKAGFYTVTYRATDSFGNTTFATRLIEVRPKGNNNPSGDFPPTNPDWGKNDKWEIDKVNKIPKPPTQPDQTSDSTGDEKPEINIDINGDGKLDINIDIDGDGKPDIDIDTDGDKKPDINIDIDGDKKSDINIDADGDKKSDINIDTDGDKKSDINIDTDGDKKSDINIDIDGDKKSDINIDIDGDKKSDINIDTDGDKKPDINIDTNGDGKVKEKNNPKTGDLMRIEIYSAAILSSIACIFRYRRRNKKTLK